MFLQQTMTGLSVGLVYATVAMGLMLLLRAAGVMNFAQGNLLAMGGYIGFAFMEKLKLSNGVLMVLLGIAVFILVGCIFCGLCFFPFKRSKWPQAMMICTLGAGTVINELCLRLVTTETKALAPIIPGSFSIGGFVIRYQYLFIFGAMILMMTGLFFLFDKMYCGRVMSAAAQNKYAADLLGIPTNLTTIVTFCLVVCMVGFSGWLLAPIYYVSASMATFQARAFASIVIGGFGNLKGAIVGGVVVGLIEAYSTYFTTTYKDVVVFGALLLMLFFRPTGILKSATAAEKA
nr:branched-chain amino acid ABC transporter permease [Feifania hominis]